MRNSRFTTHHSPLTTHDSQLTTHHSLLTTHNSSFTTHKHIPLTVIFVAKSYHQNFNTMLHNIGLFFHVTGILIAGGGSIAGILAEVQMWKHANTQPENARLFFPIMKKAPDVIMVGLLLFLLSGLVMLYSVNWIFFQSPWFIAKLVCFLLLPINGATIAKPTMAIVARELQSGNPDKTVLLKLRTRMMRFHILQFTLVAIIFFLIIFKV